MDELFWLSEAQMARIELGDVPCQIVLSAGLTVTVSILEHKADMNDGGRRGAGAARACEEIAARSAQATSGSANEARRSP